MVHVLIASGCFKSRATECLRSPIVGWCNFVNEMNCVQDIAITSDVPRQCSGKSEDFPPSLSEKDLLDR